MMNIIAASRLRGQSQPEPNTFIGGIQNDITTASELALYLNGVSESNIFNFQLFNSGVSAFIDSSFSFPGISTNSITQKITKIIYLGENNIIIDNSPSMGPEVNPKIRVIASPNGLFYIGDRTFFNKSPLRYCLIPKTTQLGSTLGDNEVTKKVTNNGNAVFSQAAETANSGSPDVDIQDLISKNWNVKYNQDNTKPAASTINASTIGGTYVESNVSKPTHVNTLKYALVFVDGFFQDVYDINSVYALNLQEQTGYDIKVIIADEYFNISPYSNTINVTTTTIPLLYQNAAAYYKLDEISGDAIDVINGYNGALFGGVTQGVAGKIGNAYSFDGTSGYIDLGDNDNFSITNGTNDIAFTIRCWVNLNLTATQMLWGKAEPGSAEYYFRIAAGKISLQLFSQADTSIFLRKNTIADVITNQWTHIIATYDGSNIKIYQNGVEESTTDASSGTYLGMANTSASVQISRNKFVNSQFIDGDLDEVAIIKGEAWTAGQVSDDYNNGNGTTI